MARGLAVLPGSLRWPDAGRSGPSVAGGGSARREESLTSKEFSACVAIAIHEPDGVVCAVVKGLPCRRPSRPARGSGSGVLFDDESAQLVWRKDLSDVELRVLHGVFDDLTDRAIAQRLGIAEGTVHTHFKRLHDKLGVSTRAVLVVAMLAEIVGTPHPLYTELGRGIAAPPLDADFPEALS